jgi:hypothetical protein
LPAISTSRRLVTALTDNAGIVALCSFWLLMLIVVLPAELVQDSWLTLLSGREVAQHGLPAADHLTVWTREVRWTDQQWLAQLAFYGLYVLGGVRAVLLTHVVVLAATATVGLIAARRLGASQASVAVAGIASLGVAPWALQMRSQTFAQVLFVAVLWLLAADSRSPGRRVFFVLPLLVVWANVHGTVVLGAGLVIVRGLTRAWAHLRRDGEKTRSWKSQAALLTFAPVPCLFASPYGASLLDYYHRMLGNPALRNFIDEWGPSTPSHKTRLFYAVAFVTVWLLGRYRNRLTGFEQLALVATLVAGVTSMRSIIWFGLTALVLLPQLVDGAFAGFDFRSVRRVRPTVVVACSALLSVGALAFAASQPASWYVQAWPGSQARTLLHAAACDRSTRVFADDRYADWLLFVEPRMRGRVAYDVRFELFTTGQFRDLLAYRNRVGDDWRRAAAGYDIVALDPTLQESVLQGMRSDDRFVRVYRDPTLAILARPRTQRTLAAASNACDSRGSAAQLASGSR